MLLQNEFKLAATGLVFFWSLLVPGAWAESPTPGLASRSTVALLGYDDTGDSAICSGVLIAEDTVVTAAHCLEGASGVEILFGPNVFRPVASRWATEGTYSKSFFSIIPSRRFDAAYVRFPGGLPEGYLGSQVLPESYQLKAGEDVLVAGYGVTEVGKGDEGVYREKRLRILDPQYSSMEVSLEQRSPGSVCPGDSGGPAFVEADGQLYFWGITNAGFGTSAPCGDFMIFADYRDAELQSQMKQVVQPLRVIR